MRPLWGRQPLQRRALSVLRAALGPAHPELAPVLANLAYASRRAGRPEEAAALYRKAIGILKPAVEPSHPTLIACREGYRAARAG